MNVLEADGGLIAGQIVDVVGLQFKAGFPLLDGTQNDVVPQWHRGDEDVRLERILHEVGTTFQNQAVAFPPCR